MTKLKKFKLWQNFKKSNCDKSQKLKLWQNSIYDESFKESLVTWHLDNQWDVLWAAFCDLAMFFLCKTIMIVSQIFTYFTQLYLTLANVLKNLLLTIIHYFSAISVKMGTFYMRREHNKIRNTQNDTSQKWLLKNLNIHICRPRK